ncbi:MAG: ABC transporter ATP-binding protein [Coriobacteriia bacterium]|nr:ABC transporter ATP-binding protein [Coriobacteriia bacterium]
MTAPLLSVEDITLQIRGETVLREVSLTCSPGEVVGITGRNGSGKSMLFKCIAGLCLPQVGEIVVDGFPVVSRRRFPPDLGVLIEKPGFLGALSAYENLAVLASIQDRVGRSEILDALRVVGLSEHAQKRVRVFSLGMKQRLGIAQAIMERPRLVILDEPTSGLDGAGVEMLRRLVADLRERGAAVLVASHLAEDIAALCDRSLHMEAGRLGDPAREN